MDTYSPVPRHYILSLSLSPPYSPFMDATTSYIHTEIFNTRYTHTTCVLNT